MGRLVVVSNRVAPIEEGKPPTGGLAVGLAEALKAHGGIWFGWSGETKNRPRSTLKKQAASGIQFVMMDLNTKDFEQYYSGYSNRALWPLFHSRIDLTAYQREDLQGYLRVNRLFAEQLTGIIQAADLVWIHDYHLIPLADELRRRGFKNRMGFFLHTPFPPFDLIQTLPNHKDLIRRLAAYDVVGLQTQNDVANFADCLRRMGGTADEDGTCTGFERKFLARAFPIGIETETIEKLSAEGTRSKQVQRFTGSLHGRYLLMGVDRLDYSKGLIHRFEGYGRFLERHPEFRGKATFLQIAPPSRSKVPEYKELHERLNGIAGELAGRYSEPDWLPVHYLNRQFNRDALVGFFRASRIGLVTPLKDGMNLVAKEFVAAQRPEDPGVLILSPFAGAAQELTDALIVNPYDQDAMGDAIAEALSMPLDERIARWRLMMDKLRANTIVTWRDAFLAALRESVGRGGRASPKKASKAADKVAAAAKAGKLTKNSKTRRKPKS